MRAKTIQIVWHTKEPVFAVDFHPTHTNLLATGGADKDIKVHLHSKMFETTFFFVLALTVYRLFHYIPLGEFSSGR